MTLSQIDIINFNEYSGDISDLEDYDFVTFISEEIENVKTEEVYVNSKNNLTVLPLTENENVKDYYTLLPGTFYEGFVSANLNKLLKNSRIKTEKIYVSNFGWVKKWDNLSGNIDKAEFSINNSLFSAKGSTVRAKELKNESDLNSLINAVSETYF